MEFIAAHQLATLGHPQRLAVFRLLVRRLPDAVPAGQIAHILALKPNTASVYLGALKEAGLVTQQRRGTSLLYRADIGSAEALISFLFHDCCRSRPTLCGLPSATSSDWRFFKPDRKINVLFICTGNSARSIFAEAILRAEASETFGAFSAGSVPRSEPNPLAIDMLNSRGIETAWLRAKSISEYQTPDAPDFNFVFTVCDLAANKNYGAWGGQPITAHWGLPDPVKASGTDAEKQRAFQHTFDALRNRIRAFAALPFETLDRARLQACVDEIGKTPEIT
jgi:protein-tyrosine-phosphatase/DNA-binding transcriptional ArsR family regulator